MSHYLTEENLGEALSFIFPGAVFVHNRVAPDLPKRIRPKYRAEELKLIVEFDGPRHYTKPGVILKDEEYDRLFTHAGYEVARIPYFVQLSTEVLVRLFGTSRHFKQPYPHGFVDDNAPLPAEFCCMGIERFIADLERFAFIQEDILKSLEQKVAQLGDERLVYPVSKKAFFKRAGL
jgi:hypothetical protein